MDEKPPKPSSEHTHAGPALTPQGVPADSWVNTHDPDVIALGPEMAIAEGDVPFSDEDEFVRGSSLWRDAWRRLLKNKLAIFGW